MMRNIVTIATVIGILLGIYFVIFHHGKSKNTPLVTDSTFKVLMFLPGEINDGSWNQVGYEAITKIGKERNIQIYLSTSAAPDQIDSLFVSFANEKSLFVIGLGGEYIDAFERIALKYPQYKFALVGRHPGNGKNLGSLNEQPGVFFLAGAVAAMKSQTGIIATLIGDKLAHTSIQAQLFDLGARAVNPDIKIISKWVGSWDNANSALKQCSEIVDNSADIILVNVDKVNFNVLHFLQEKKLKAISVVTDERKRFPETVIAAILTNTFSRLNGGLELFLQGKWEGKMYSFGLVEGATELGIQEKLLSDAEERRLNEFKTDIIQGKLLLPNQME